jgi:dihydroneopterin triphosphate diphosphatase
MMAEIVSRIVEVCVFRFRRDRPEYLLLRRSSLDPLYPNLWQLISGGIREGETAVAAARRELSEETGLIPVYFWIVPHMSTFYDPSHDRTHISPLFATQVSPDLEPKLSDEHQACAWLSVGDARTRLVWPGQRRGLEIVHDYLIRGEEAAGLARIDL